MYKTIIRVIIALLGIYYTTLATAAIVQGSNISRCRVLSGKTLKQAIALNDSCHYGFYLGQGAQSNICKAPPLRIDLQQTIRPGGRPAGSPEGAWTQFSLQMTATHGDVWVYTGLPHEGINDIVRRAMTQSLNDCFTYWVY